MKTEVFHFYVTHSLVSEACKYLKYDVIIMELCAVVWMSGFNSCQNWKRSHINERNVTLAV